RARARQAAGAAHRRRRAVRRRRGREAGAAARRAGPVLHHAGLRGLAAGHAPAGRGGRRPAGGTGDRRVADARAGLARGRVRPRRLSARRLGAGPAAAFWCDGGCAGTRGEQRPQETGGEPMPDETRHESADLTDYEVQEPSDSLDDDAGYDPLDRGVAPPQRWSAGMRFGTTADEQRDGESLDQQLAEEEPDPSLDLGDEEPLSESGDDDEDLADEDIDGLLLDD